MSISIRKVWRGRSRKSGEKTRENKGTGSGKMISPIGDTSDSMSPDRLSHVGLDPEPTDSSGNLLPPWKED